MKRAQPQLAYAATHIPAFVPTCDQLSKRMRAEISRIPIRTSRVAVVTFGLVVITFACVAVI